MHNSGEYLGGISKQNVHLMSYGDIKGVGGGGLDAMIIRTIVGINCLI